MINHRLLHNRDAWRAWYKEVTDAGAFYIPQPEHYPALVVWSFHGQAFHHKYISMELAGGPLQFGRLATDEDIVAVGQWLKVSGCEVKIKRDGLEYNYKNDE